MTKIEIMEYEIMEYEIWRKTLPQTVRNCLGPSDLAGMYLAEHSQEELRNMASPPIPTAPARSPKATRILKRNLELRRFKATLKFKAVQDLSPFYILSKPSSLSTRQFLKQSYLYLKHSYL